MRSRPAHWVPRGDEPRRLVVLAVLLGLFAALGGVARAEPVTTIQDNGDPERRIDIVFLGDGYTSSQLGQYATNVETAVAGIFAEEPFTSYRSYFNVHRIDVVSNESGADHPERSPPEFVDTALGASFNCSGIRRLLCVDFDAYWNVLPNSVLGSEREIPIILVNDTQYGGAGGIAAIASVNPTYMVGLVMHEMGHSFGRLADEYTSSPPPCDLSQVSRANVTNQTEPALIKWNAWIDALTPIPTLDTAPGVPGLYEGARYCETGLYRPTYESKMRQLTRPFEQVNAEQLLRRIYNWMSPIDTTTPAARALTAAHGAVLAFEVQVPAPLTHTLDVVWRVNETTVGTADDIVVDTATLDPGPQTVEVAVLDPTALVRNDPAGVLSDVKQWVVALGLPVPDRGVDASKCSQAIGKIGRKLVDGRLNRLASCALTVMKCVQQHPGDQRCLDKATRSCARKAEQLASDAVTLTEQLERKCADVDTSDLLDAVGLWYDGLADTCASEFSLPLATVEDVAACVVRHQVCRAEEAFAAQVPRGGELLRLAGVPADPDGCREDHGGIGAGAGGKDLVRCQQAIAKSGRDLLARKLKAAQQCIDAMVRCVQRKPGDQQCIDKAVDKCASKFGSFRRDDARHVERIEARCLELDFATLRAASGLNLDAASVGCATLGVPGLATLEDYETCVLRQRDCAVHRVMHADAPRVDELLHLAELTLAEPFCTVAGP